MVGSDVHGPGKPGPYDEHGAPDRAERPAAGGWNPVDRLFVAYGALAAVPLAWGTFRGVPGCARGLLVNAALIAFAVLFVRATRAARHPLVLLARLAYVPIGYWTYYSQTATIWPVLYGAPFDATIAGLDRALFGFQPSLAWPERMPSPLLSELFCGAYFGYYLYVPVLLLATFFGRGYDAAGRLVFRATLCFYCFYAFFWLFPTVGPHYWFPPHAGPELYRGYVFNHLLHFFTARGEVPTGAFPSSHVAVAVLLTLSARRDAPRLFPALCAVTAVMLGAVVYLRAHYVVDVPSGIAVGVLFALGADRIGRAME